MRLFIQTASLKYVTKMICFICVLLGIFAHGGLLGKELVNEKPRLALVFDDNSGAHKSALLLSSSVSIDVTGLISRVKVKQVFENNTEDWINATYLFPLPENAAIIDLRIKIAERVIIGEIKEKKKARKEYKKAKIAGKKASLIEQKHHDIFSSAVANIPPGEKVFIEIEYQHSITYKAGTFSLYYPMAITPRYAPSYSALTTAERHQYLANIANKEESEEARLWSEKWNKLEQEAENSQFAIQTSAVIKDINDPDLFVEISIALHTPLALKNINSPYHRIIIDKQDDHATLIKLGETQVIADRDFVLNWQLQQTEKAESALFLQDVRSTEQTSERSITEKYGLLMLMPSAIQYSDSARINKEVLFVIDVSGSMSGTSIRQAKRALNFAIGQLSDNDTFNIIAFSNSSDYFASNALPVGKRTKLMAKNYIKQLQAAGGTNMKVAIHDALLGQRTVFPNKITGLRQVVFVTDASISNEQQLLTQIDQQLGDSRLFMVGIGSAPNHYFMKNSAKLGKGTYTHIADINEVDTKMVALFKQLSTPLLRDLTMQWSDGSVVDYWPAPLRDLYQGEPLQFVFKIPSDKKQLSISGSLFIDNSAIPWSQHFNLAQQEYKQATGLDILWAKEQVDSIDLSRQLSAQQKQEKITALGLKFQMVTKYTSLVAIEQSISRPTLHNSIDKQVKTHLPYGNTMRLPQTGLASLLYLQLGGLLLFIVILCWFIDHYLLPAKKNDEQRL